MRLNLRDTHVLDIVTGVEGQKDNRLLIVVEGAQSQHVYLTPDELENLIDVLVQSQWLIERRMVGVGLSISATLPTLARPAMLEEGEDDGA